MFSFHYNYTQWEQSYSILGLNVYAANQIESDTEKEDVMAVIFH